MADSMPSTDPVTNAPSSSAFLSSQTPAPKPTSIQPTAKVTSKVSPSPTSQNPSIIQRAWKSIGLSPLVIMIMVKPAVAATVAMAIYQKHSVAAHYLNLGYLIIIVSITTVPILPRGKFLMNLVLSLILTCFACGMVALGQFCGIKARQHTTPIGASTQIAYGYNSSASAVNAIFLIVNLFGINTLRAFRPVFSIPTIQYTVFICVGFIFGPSEPTWSACQKLIKELLYSFLTGQGIATVVALFVIPVSSRKVFFGEAVGYLQSCQVLLRSQMAFIEVLEHSKMCNPSLRSPSDQVRSDPADTAGTVDQRASSLKAASDAILSLGSKLRDDVVFARRETAYGHLRETDVLEFYDLLRAIMIPISGLSTIVDISERLAAENEDGSENKNQDINYAGEADKSGNERAEWIQMMKGVANSFEGQVTLLEESILHILVLLKLVPAPKKRDAVTDDIEKGSSPHPGTLGFGDYLDQRMQAFRIQRSDELKSWASERGLDSVLSSARRTAALSPLADKNGMRPEQTSREVLASKRIHIILYMEYLLYQVSISILATIRFAELKASDGTFSRKRLILPALNTLVKWVSGVINGEDSGPDIDNLEQGAENLDTIYLGASFHKARDPEHLPPRTAWQRFSNHLRVFPRFFKSAPAKYGLRVCVAVMSVGIMAYLKQTHEFFTRQRIVWCLVMIGVGMSPTSGSAVFNMAGSLTFTLIGMIGSFINWYIVDQKTAGVIVVFFFFMMFYFYFCARYPRFLVPIVAGALTHVLIIGYELQIRVIGIAQSTATGQPYYPIYELAPYRLLTVGAGILVAWIFTVFPVPITESSVLRGDLGASLFLLANYLSAVTATVDQRIDDNGEGTEYENSPGRKLDELREKALQKQVALLTSMRLNLSFLPWEPRVGGEFPSKIYQALVDEVQNMTNYLTIIAYASETFPTARKKAPWLSTFARARSTTEYQSHKVSSLLALVSASIRNGQPLTPHLKPPTHFLLSDELVRDDTHVLDLSNLNEPGFRAIAVIEVAQRCLINSVEQVLNHVKELVGELDFSYHVSKSSETLDQGEGKQKIG